MKYLFIPILIFSLISCTENQKLKKSKSVEVKQDSTSIINSKDTQLQIKAKLAFMAGQLNTEFGELILYDDYFNDTIIKYYLKPSDSEQRFVTAVIYDNRVRYIKTLLQHVGNTSSENKDEHYKRIKGSIDKKFKSGEYVLMDDVYAEVNKNGDVWCFVTILSESKRTGTQDYWNIISPKADYDYLKFMVNAFTRLEGLEYRFLFAK